MQARASRLRAGRCSQAEFRIPRHSPARQATVSLRMEAAPRVRHLRQTVLSRTGRAVTETAPRATGTEETRTIREAVLRPAATECARAVIREGMQAAPRARATREAVTEAVRAVIREAVTEAAPRARVIREAATEAVPRARVIREAAMGAAVRARVIREAVTEAAPRAREAARADIIVTETDREDFRAVTEAVQADFREETETGREDSREETEAALRGQADGRREAVRDRRIFPSPLTRLLRQSRRATEAIRMPIKMINMIREI